MKFTVQITLYTQVEEMYRGTCLVRTRDSRYTQIDRTQALKCNRTSVMCHKLFFVMYTAIKYFRIMRTKVLSSPSSLVRTQLHMHTLIQFAAISV